MKTQILASLITYSDGLEYRVVDLGLNTYYYGLNKTYSLQELQTFIETNYLVDRVVICTPNKAVKKTLEKVGYTVVLLETNFISEELEIQNENIYLI